MSQQVGSKGPGRPPLLDDKETIDALLEHLREGMTRADACALVGVSYAWLKKAMARGRAGEPRYVAFLADVKKARREGIKELVDCLRLNAKKGCPTSAIFLLKAERPERYNRAAVQRVELTQAGQKGGLGALEEMPREDAIKVLRAYLERLESPPNGAAS